MRRVALVSALALAACGTLLAGAARAPAQAGGCSPRRPTWAGITVLRAGRRLPRDQDPARGGPAQDQRSRGQGLPADLARRRLVAGPARRRRKMVRQCDAMASRIAWLAGTLHANGFKLGVYTDAGSVGCGVQGRRLRHYQQDINTLAAWASTRSRSTGAGGVTASLDPAPSTRRSTRRSSTIESPADAAGHLQLPQPGRRPERAGVQPSEQYSSLLLGPSNGNSWRTNTEVGSAGQTVPFSAVLRNMDAGRNAADGRPARALERPGLPRPDQGMGPKPVQRNSACGRCLRRR